MKEKKVLKIKDLSFISFNRPVDNKHVDRLLSSIKRNGILRLPVIVFTRLFSAKPQYNIVDGQHLVLALVKAGITEVECIVTKSESTSEIVGMMASLNNTSRSWKIEDYVKAFNAMGNDNYRTLHVYKIGNNLPYSVCGMILGGSSINEIKTGTFKIQNSDADKISSYVIDVCALMGTKNSKFMKALIRFIRHAPEYKHKTFMEKLAKESKNLTIVHDEVAMRNSLNTIYSR